MSAISYSRSVTPAAIAGVTRSFELTHYLPSRGAFALRASSGRPPSGRPLSRGDARRTGRGEGQHLAPRFSGAPRDAPPLARHHRQRKPERPVGARGADQGGREAAVVVQQRQAPWENGYVESFNGKLRDELLRAEVFNSLREAQVLIEQWRHHYNTARPHSALGYRPPAPEVVMPPLPVPLPRPGPAGAAQPSSTMLH